MLIKNSQQDIEIDLPEHVKTVGLKISGGADSAITGYILTKYVHEYRPDIKIQPVTVDQEGKSFQVQFAKRIVEFYKQEFADYFLPHITGYSEIEERDYISTQQDIMDELYASKKIDCHFVGLTRNPPRKEIPRKLRIGEPPDRIRQQQQASGRGYKPFVNIDKKGVAEVYQQLDLMDTLFPLTRSCGKHTDDFTKHCEECWSCAERFYGFNRY